MMLGAQPVPRVDQYRYLGVQIHNRGPRWKTVAATLAKAGKSAIAKLRAIGCEAGALTPQLSRRMFCSVGRPAMEFACEVWNLRKKEEQQLESIQGQFAKKALGLPLKTNTLAACKELGVHPLWARRDDLRLRWWGRWTEGKMERMVSAVFRSRCEDVEEGRTRTSTLVTYKELLQRYGMEQHWRNRSIDDNWKKVVSDAVKGKVDEAYAKAAESSPSLSMLLEMSPAHGPPIWEADSRNPVGLWVKRRLRTGTLPLLSIVSGWWESRSLEWSDEAKLCPLCFLEEDSAVHFVTGCRWLRTEREEMLIRLSRLPNWKNTEILTLHRCHMDAGWLFKLLLGGRKENGQEWSRASTLAIHAVSRDYLARCWKRRTRALGGVPCVREGQLTFVQTLTPSW